jgi:hypothetical protein
MGLFSKFFRRVGARPLSRYSISATKGADTLPESTATPEDMHIKSVKNLARKERVAKRRNESRLRKGKVTRRYLASLQGVK